MRGMVVCMVGILVGVSTAAWATNYGAIAYDQPTGSWGASYDQPSQPAANARALQECGQYATACAVVVLPLVVSVDVPVAGVSRLVGCTSVTSKSLITV